MTDPISDMLTRIRNASAVKKAEVRVPFSKMKLAVAKVLAQEGFLTTVDKAGEGTGAELRLGLKYEAGEPAVLNLKRVSKPSRRAYAGYNDLPRVLSDRGIAIVSTSQGVMSNKEARRRKLGGEVICEVF